MANGMTRQYIGARYVPVFADPVEWDNERTYEPLMMVQHQGETYMTKQYVPVGIPLPAVSGGQESNDYWVHMSNWNAQVEGYRKEVLRYAAEVLLYNDRITAVEGATAGYNAQNTIADAIAAVNQAIDTVSGSVTTLGTAVDGKLAEKAFAFDTVADMKAGTNLFNGAVCHTSGFASAGDGGAAWYEISDTGTANEMDVIACGDLFATMIAENEICPMQFGANGDGVTDDSSVFTYIASKSDVAVNLENKKYLIAECVNISGENIVFKNGKIKATASDFTDYAGVFNALQKNGIVFDGIEFIGTGALNTGSFSGRLVSLRECENVKFVNCTATKIQYGYVCCFENCSHGEFCNNLIDEYTFMGVSLLNGGNDFKVNDNTILNCVNTTYVNTYPISLSGGDGEYEREPSRNVVCCGNYIDNVYSWWEGIDAHCLQYGVISNNVIRNCYSGIAVVQFKSNVTEQAYYSQNVVIANNTIELGETGISKSASNAGITLTHANNCEITGNVIKNANKLTSAINQNGLTLSFCSNVTVSSNEVYCDRENCIGLRNTNSKINVNGNKFFNKRVDYFVYMDGLNELCFFIGNIFHTDTVTTDSRYFRGGSKDDTNPNQYVAFKNNVTNVTLASRHVEGNVLPDLYTPPTAIHAGYLGHIVIRSNPSSGSSIGWICTEAATSSTAAVWTALPNYA